MTNTMVQFAERLIATGVASADSIRPCTPAEVAEVSADHGLACLPAQYDEFLRVMGRQAGDLLVGTDFFYPGILGLDASARELLQENGASHLLPAGAIVIGMHQGYELYWLAPSGEVSYYSEGRRSIKKTWPTLLACLADYAEYQAQFNAKYEVLGGDVKWIRPRR
jgi:hypothetical protein